MLTTQGFWRSAWQGGLVALVLASWVPPTNACNPRLSVSPSSLDFGFTRVGETSSPLGITAKNTGDWWLTGTFGAPAPGGSFFFASAERSFTLAPNGSISASYTFTPGARGSYSTNVAVTGAGGIPSNATFNHAVALHGTGVGPVYQGALLSGGPAGGSMIAPQGAATLAVSTLHIENATTDAPGALTDLTLLSAALSGPGAAAFELVNFVPGTVLEKGKFLDLVIMFDGTAGPHGAEQTALLTIVTDQDAPLGQAGTSFSYQLRGVCAPEPAAVLIWSIIGLGACGWWRRSAAERLRDRSEWNLAIHESAKASGGSSHVSRSARR